MNNNSGGNPAGNATVQWCDAATVRTVIPSYLFLNHAINLRFYLWVMNSYYSPNVLI